MANGPPDIGGLISLKVRARLHLRQAEWHRALPLGRRAAHAHVGARLPRLLLGLALGVACGYANADQGVACLRTSA